MHNRVPYPRRLTAIGLLFASQLALSAPPATPKKPVANVYHGVTVTDDYQWLENWNDKDVQAWSAGQNAHAREVLAKLPGVEILHAELTKIMAAKTVSHSALAVRGEKVFALRREPPKEQPFLVVFPALNKPEAARVLLDPNELDKEGTTSIDWFVPSPDGKLVAISISAGGSESGDVHVVDAETGAKVDIVIPRVNGGTAGGDLAWAPDGKGFFYTRYPRAGELPPEEMDFHQQLFFHKLGTATETDRYELGKELPRIAEIIVAMDDSSGRLLCSVQDGDSGRYAQFIRSPGGAWKQFADFNDAAVYAALGSNDTLLVVSRKDAPRGRLLRMNAAAPDLAKAVEIIPQAADNMVTDFYTLQTESTLVGTADRIYVTYQLGGPSVIRCFDYDGKPVPAPKQPDVAAVSHVVPAGKGNDVVFSATSYVAQPDLYLFNAAAGTTDRLPLTSPPVVDFSDVNVVRELATSKDGTKIPVTILIPKGAKRDGKSPCLATGYGGYGLNFEPAFDPSKRVLLDRGFVLAFATLRGGGEFGETWHRAGSLTNKQNVFDDFAAALQHLIDRQYTSPQKLAIEGASNGGLLMGATFTQHPDLMKCVVSHVGFYDSLRGELSPNGTFNIPEFGTVKDEAQFKALYAYAPYHHVKEGVKYPPTLFLTGENDPRVDPLESRKMTARMQAASPEGTVLLRTTAGSGHGLAMGLSDLIDETTDICAFLCWQLGIEVQPKADK